MALALALTATGWMAPRRPRAIGKPVDQGDAQGRRHDLYMFRSYESGRENYVTLLADYIPIQAPYAAPTSSANPDARYQINIEADGTDGDDLVLRVPLLEVLKDQQLNVGGVPFPHPLRTVNRSPSSTTPTTPTSTPSPSSATACATREERSHQRHLLRQAFDNAGSKTIAVYAT